MNSFFEDTYSCAIKLRYPSWSGDLDYNFFRNNNVALSSSKIDKLPTRPLVTSDFIYPSLIGNRRLTDAFGNYIELGQRRYFGRKYPLMH
jgi:hypothetical protein